MATDERRASMSASAVEAESRARGAAAHGPHVRHWKSGRDAYFRVRDIRAQVMAEDERRGRCTW